MVNDIHTTYYEFIIQLVADIPNVDGYCVLSNTECKILFSKGPRRTAGYPNSIKITCKDIDIELIIEHSLGRETIKHFKLDDPMLLDKTTNVIRHGSL